MLPSNSHLTFKKPNLSFGRANVIRKTSVISNTLPFSEKLATTKLCKSSWRENLRIEGMEWKRRVVKRQHKKKFITIYIVFL